MFKINILLKNNLSKYSYCSNLAFLLTSILVIVLIYCKYVSIMLLKEESLVLDIALYLSAFMALLTRRYYDWKILFILGYFAILSILNPAAKNIFLILLTVYILSPFSINQISKINLILELFVIILVAVLLSAGVLHNKLFALGDISDPRTARWDMGFGNPNVFALFIYAILINWYIIIQDKCYNLYLLGSAIISVLVFHYTGSRSFLIGMLLIWISSLALKIKIMKKLLYKCKLLLYPLPLVFIFVTIYCSINVSEFEILNLILTGRLRLYHNLLAECSSFSYIVGNASVMDELIDSAYIHLLLEGGILAVLIFSFLWVIFIKNLNNSNIYLFPIFISVLLYGLTESVFTAILNYGIIIVWSILFAEYISFCTSKNKIIHHEYS